MLKPWEVQFNFNAEDGGGAGAEGPAPEATPAGQPAGAPKESSGAENLDFVLEAFEQLGNDDVDYGDEEAPEATPAPEPSLGGDPKGGTEAPTAKPTEEPKQVEKATASTPALEQGTPAVKPQEAAAPSASETQSPAGAPGLEPEKILEKLSDEVSKHRDVFQKALAEQQYTMTQQDLEEFTEDPGKVIGKIAARVHVNVVESLSKMFAQQMPLYVNGLMKAQARNEQGESKFWDSNPHLDRTKHRDVVLQVAQVFRKMNPNADEATTIRAVGAMAGGALGLAAQAAVQAANAASNASSVQTPGKIVRATSPGFSPAGVHTAPPNSQGRPQENPWTTFTREMLEIDD
jgi:hypothetical protein